MAISNWRRLSWGDISTLEYGKRLIGYKGKTEGYPVFGTNGQVGYTDKPLVNSSGVIIGRKGAYRGVKYTEKPFYVIDTAFYLKPKDYTQLDLKWSYYSLLTTDINRIDSGSAIPSTSRDDFYNLEVNLPPLDEQKRIANFLSNLDRKIDLNNKMNKKLEEMAQAIFKQWFVDFEFPNEGGKPYKSSGGKMVESELGMIPDGWKVGCIGDYVKVKSGYAFKSEWWEESGIPVIKIKDIENNTLNINDMSYVSPEKKVVAKDFLVQGGDLVIAMTGATIGKFGIVPRLADTMLVNQRVGKFFLGDKPVNKLGFIYCLLKQQSIYDELVNRGSGSAQPNISPTGIETIKIILPSFQVLEEFNNAVKVFFEKITEDKYQNDKLRNIRDILLPKLMEGEILVPVK
ncbi:restriction endonuclease subunit S [Bacillus toyonensis]|uniref:restriction endonuclease subunit S n=1 Tax=Bacillus toyonensis TaxID=155322 RepID=UPI00339623A9